MNQKIESFQESKNQILYNINAHVAKMNIEKEKGNNGGMTEEESKKLSVNILMKMVEAFIEIAQNIVDKMSQVKQKRMLLSVIKINRDKLTQLKSIKNIEIKKQKQVERKKSIRQRFEDFNVRIPSVEVSPYYLFFLLKNKEFQMADGKEKQGLLKVTKDITNRWKSLTGQEKQQFQDFAIDIKTKSEKIKVSRREAKKDCNIKAVKEQNVKSGKKKDKKASSTIKFEADLADSSDNPYSDILSDSLNSQIQAKDLKETIFPDHSQTILQPSPTNDILHIQN